MRNPGRQALSEGIFEPDNRKLIQSGDNHCELIA